MTMEANTKSCKALIDSQAAKGLNKYFRPLEQSELTVSQLANMGAQEMADALAYSVALEVKAKELEEENERMRAGIHKAMTAPTIGSPFGGGFFAGTFLLNDQIFALVVAPKAEGETELKWKMRRTSTAGTRSLRDGMDNSQAMANANHPAAAFCRDLTIGGFDDWYLPSRHEAALLAENLMPGSDYVPEQTATEAFQEGGAEAFDRSWYWTSTEFSSGYAWVQFFFDGYQDGLSAKDWSCRVRAVRKVPFNH